MTPTLPTELWLDILSLAVHEPGLFETKWDYSPDEQIWEGGVAQIIMTTKSLQIRRTITLVSRAWWMLARRFLYEDVDIDMESNDNVLQIAAFLEQYSPGVGGQDGSEHSVGIDSAGSVNRGLWVKRINLFGQILRDEVSPGVLRILGACSNVRILYIDLEGFNPSFIPQLSQVLQSRFTHSLRHISIHADQPNEATEGLHSLIELPNIPLDAFFFITIPVTLSRLNEPFPPPAFTSISALGITMPGEAFEPKLPSFALPALRYLAISSFFDLHIDPLQSFIKLHGRLLLGLRLHPGSHCPRLHQFLEHTPVLRSLVIESVHFNTFDPPGNPKYPSITHIGIDGEENANSIYSVPPLRGLHYILPRQLFPNLRIVRIITRDPPELRHPVWEGAITVAAEYGIRLEDFNRKLLQCEKLVKGE